MVDKKPRGALFQRSNKQPQSLYCGMLWLGVLYQLSFAPCFHLMHSPNSASPQPLVKEVSQAHGIKVRVTELVAEPVQDRLSQLLGHYSFCSSWVLPRKGRLCFVFIASGFFKASVIIQGLKTIIIFFQGILSNFQGSWNWRREENRAWEWHWRCCRGRLS